MSVPNLTSDQRKAATTVDRPLCIRAGAGCGKTGVLAYHYGAWLLMKKLKPQEIVAVTFTEKAAAELKNRIQRVLREGLEKKLPFQEIALISPEEIGFLLQEIPSAPISTLHGLAGRIVRDASLLIGYDPHFEIIDENESHALKYEALSQSMEEMLGRAEADLKTLLSAYGWGTLERQLFAMLEDWPRWKTAPTDLPDRSSPDQRCEAAGSPPISRIAAVRGRLHPALPVEGATRAPIINEKELWRALKGVFESVLQAYDRLKQGHQAVDFNDLEEEAIKLLERYPHVIRHYQKLWKAFLIDEFQDTNPRQDRLISLLLLGIQNSSPLTPHSLLPKDRHLAIVGDDKQSIYSFRGADPSLFRKYQESIEAGGGLTVTLSENFRNPPGLLRWVNGLFSGIFPSSPPLISQKSDPSDPPLEVLALPPKDGERLSAEERRLLEAGVLADRVTKLLAEGLPPHEVFILFRSLSPAPLYLKIFRERKLPVYIKSSESLLQRQEILDLIHALQAVVEPENPLPWVGLLRSPAVGFSDERILERSLHRSPEFQWWEIHPLTQKIRAKNKTMGPYEFLKWFLDETDLVTLYASDEAGSLKSQNILQFLELAYHWENHRAQTLEAFFGEIRNMRENNVPLTALSDKLGLGEAITFMTIHQAKGLDLPVVCLPDLGTPLRREAVSIAELWQDRVGLKLPSPGAGLKRSFTDSETLGEIRDEKFKNQLQEEDRIFYVAVTRAEKKLILGFLPDNEKKNIPAYAAGLAASLKEINPTVLRAEGEGASLPRAAGAPQRDPALPPSPLAPFKRARFTHFAVTQVECFLRSKEEYRERYLLQLPPHPSFGHGKPPEKGLGPLERGNLIHEALYFLTRDPGKSPKEILQRVFRRHTFSPEDSEEFQRLNEGLEKTVQAPAFQKILYPDEAYSEIPFLLSLPPFEVQGAMDRLLRIQNDWKVVDYKTHSIDVGAHGLRPVTGSAPLQKIAQEFEFQMKTYCLAASRMLDRPVLKAGLYFTEPNLSFDFEFSPEELQAHTEGLQKTLQEINEWAEGCL